MSKGSFCSMMLFKCNNHFCAFVGVSLQLKFTVLYRNYNRGKSNTKNTNALPDNCLNLLRETSRDVLRVTSPKTKCAIVPNPRIDLGKKPEENPTSYSQEQYGGAAGHKATGYQA